ncbi:MAG: undecaprenyl/decaprenyl-phosphate alpha-N-acetylglucosaminyl 1-phosphate transferase [Gudongella sp.]|nr:undecaprenyl/decaprenyl-phosphate alpha-N-acetylglucosaminyl 1-phosphate transferase [Gudongella sp.]
METIWIPFVVAAVIAFAATPFVIKIAPKIGAMDIPKDDRRVHKDPMPLIGGVAMYLAIAAGMFVFLPKSRDFITIFAGATIILISGLKDDIRGTTPKEKLFYQLLAAAIVIWGGVQVDFVTNPFADGNPILYLSWIGIPITLFWIVGITNTLNLIDGLDGLAGGVALISALSFTFVALKLEMDQIAILAALVSGACLGFLPFNFNPAKIFMGDTGALFLGFMLAVISIEGVMKSVATIAMLVPVIILGVPIFDTTFAIFRRLLSGQSIMAADKSHLHHRLLERGFSQKKTVLILYGISGMFGLFAVLVSKANSRQVVYMSAVMFVVAVIFAIKLGLFSSKTKSKEDLDR